jgi:UDP-N-acetylglucosamine--N-acetylmuramyl-(pentapeptide) pyrophosphoryl-undecaprenol N-acetylglucosamine transferase
MPVVLFLGGSQGARQINDLAAGTLAELTKKAYVVHQYGDGLAPAAPADELTASRYKAYPFIYEEMPDVLAASDIIVGRSGAGTVWEAAALGKPMVLVPLSGIGTRGDQIDNARFAMEAGAAIALIGPDATNEALARAITSIINDASMHSRMAGASRSLAPDDAALSIAKVILEKVSSER